MRICPLCNKNKLETITQAFHSACGECFKRIMKPVKEERLQNTAQGREKKQVKYLDLYLQRGRQTEKAIELFEGNFKVWLPKSQVQPRKLTDGTRFIRCPYWLAEKNGLTQTWNDGTFRYAVEIKYIEE